MSIKEVATVLRALTYIKLDLPTFLMITKKPSDTESKAQYEGQYGDALFLPSPDSIMPVLSSNNEFLKFRNERKAEVPHQDAALFNRNCALDFICGLYTKLELEYEADEKMNVYVSRNQFGKLRNHPDSAAKELYSHINRAGNGLSGKRGAQTTWG